MMYCYSFEGSFGGGVRHGSGVMIDGKGKRHHGVWSHGRRCRRSEESATLAAIEAEASAMARDERKKTSSRTGGASNGRNGNNNNNHSGQGNKKSPQQDLLYTVWPQEPDNDDEQANDNNNNNIDDDTEDDAHRYVANNINSAVHHDHGIV
jgi:hypothetical protein